MKEISEEIRQQFHEFRNSLGHLSLKVRDLEGQIADGRVSLEHRIEQVESKVLGDSFKGKDPQRQSPDLLERVMRIEEALKIPAKRAATSPSPAHEDKGSPEGLSAQ